MGASSQAPIVSWLVGRVAWIHTTRKRGSDGHTGFHRIRGKPFINRLLQIMEQCLYKLQIKVHRQKPRKLGARWRRGIFFGFNRASSQYLVCDDGKIFKAWAVQRLEKEL